jgi:hypothetical protein
MKRLIIMTLILTFCISANALGEDKKNANNQSGDIKNSCKVLLGAATYNQFLEVNCGFNARVSDYSKYIYVQAGCNKVLLPQEVEKISKSVIEDSKNQFATHGKKKFCNMNKMQYQDLANEIQKKLPKALPQEKK